LSDRPTTIAAIASAELTPKHAWSSSMTLLIERSSRRSSCARRTGASWRPMPIHRPVCPARQKFARFGRELVGLRDASRSVTIYRNTSYRPARDPVGCRPWDASAPVGATHARPSHQGERR
jgi:hypothetical protein